MNASEHIYQGVRGLEKIAEKVGIPQSTLGYRLYKKGMSLEQAIAEGLKHRKALTYHEYNGVSGLDNIAKMVGIKKATLKSRIARGMSIEEAVSKPLDEKKSHSNGGGCRKPDSEKATAHKRYQPITTPDLLSDTWKLALGMRVH